MTVLLPASIEQAEEKDYLSHAKKKINYDNKAGCMKRKVRKGSMCKTESSMRKKQKIIFHLDKSYVT